MEKIYIAKLGKTVGLKGQQKLHIDSDFPEQFKKNTKLTTRKNQELIIESYNHSNGTVKFIGIDTIEDAKKLTNQELYVSKDDTLNQCKLGKNQFFWFDIINCTVKQNDKILGEVEDIQRMPLSDYLLITTTKQLVEKGYAKSFLLPYDKNFILNVDIRNKLIMIKNGFEILEAS